MVLTTHTGRDLTPGQAACYLAACLLLKELTVRAGVMMRAFPLTEDEVALRVEAENLRRELLHRSGEPGHEPAVAQEEQAGG